MVKKKRPLLSAVVCGVSLGIALLCRPYTTAWICVPMGIAAIVTRKKLSLRYILIGAIPLLVACLTFLAYNYATTGHPLLLGYIALHGKDITRVFTRSRRAISLSSTRFQVSTW